VKIKHEEIGFDVDMNRGGENISEKQGLWAARYFAPFAILV
jgi:hypothetical protein